MAELQQGVVAEDGYYVVESNALLLPCTCKSLDVVCGDGSKEFIIEERRKVFNSPLCLCLVATMIKSSEGCNS